MNKIIMEINTVCGRCDVTKPALTMTRSKTEVSVPESCTYRCFYVPTCQGQYQAVTQARSTHSYTMQLMRLQLHMDTVAFPVWPQCCFTVKDVSTILKERW